MGFAAVFALFGVLAVAIPIYIHLTKVKQAPVVWVGDIRLLKGKKAKRFNPTNIDNWLLFILRLLIVLTLTFAAAKPFLQDVIIDNRPLALVSPNWLVAASDQQIEQLTAQYEVRHLSWQGALSSLPPVHSDSNEVENAADNLWRDDLWAILSFYDETMPKGRQFHVFTDDQLDFWYRQARPRFSRNINWHIQKLQDLPKPSDYIRAHALIVGKNASEFSSVSILIQALELLGYKTQFLPEDELSLFLQSSKSELDVIITLDNAIELLADFNLKGAIISPADWPQGLLHAQYQVDFIFTLRQVIEQAYEQSSVLKLPPHLSGARLTTEQQNVAVTANLYPETLKQSFVDHWLLILLIVLIICERLLSEYGPYRNDVKVAVNEG